MKTLKLQAIKHRTPTNFQVNTNRNNNLLYCMNNQIKSKNLNLEAKEVKFAISLKCLSSQKNIAQ